MSHIIFHVCLMAISLKVHVLEKECKKAVLYMETPVSIETLF